MLNQSALGRVLRISRMRKFTRVLVASALTSVVLLKQRLLGTGNPKPTDQAAGTTNWGGLGWGIGIATDFDVGGNRVANASIVNGLVRVSDTSSNVGIGFVLEAHYFFRDWQLPFTKNGCSPAYIGTYTFPCTDMAIGPFVAIEVGGGTSATPAANGPITAFAMGGMIGFRHLSGKITEKNATSNWNFGIGLRVDPRAQVLGDGFVANQPPPPGETAVRFKTEPRYGVMLLSSFSF
jgi:hypothetical protein